MSIIGVTASTQIIDPKTGYLTREGFNLIQTLIQSQNGTGAGATVDGTQTLTNKTIDGDRNTLSNIGTNSLKSRTGDANSVVTGAAGTIGSVMVWGAGGDAESGPAAASVPVAEDVLLRDGSQAMTGPAVLATFTVASVPDATFYTGGQIYVSDESGGATMAFSDGTNWRRVQDRAIIS